MIKILKISLRLRYRAPDPGLFGQNPDPNTCLPGTFWRKKGGRKEKRRGKRKGNWTGWGENRGVRRWGGTEGLEGTVTRRVKVAPFIYSAPQGHSKHSPEGKRTPCAPGADSGFRSGGGARILGTKILSKFFNKKIENRYTICARRDKTPKIRNKTSTSCARYVSS